MPAISPSAVGNSKPATREERIERAVLAYLGDECRPPRTQDTEALRNLEIERRAAFRLDCHNLRKVCGVEKLFAEACIYPPIKAAGPWIQVRSWQRYAEAWERLPAGYRKLAALLTGMIDEPQTLAVIGDRGRGKTHLACGLVNAFCELRRPALYARTRDYFETLSTAPWEEKAKVRERFTAPDLLVLDEVQVRDADRQWQDNELTTLIDRRYARAKSTLLLSNLKPGPLAENLGESIWRRLIETGGDPIEVTWPRILEALHCGPSRAALEGQAS